MTTEVVGLLLTVAAMGGAGAIGWGRLKAELASLEKRHAENSAEFRANDAATAQRLNAIERVQGTVDIHLDVIRSQLSDIKALLSTTTTTRRKT